MNSHGKHADGEFAHPMPIWTLLTVFFALTALTIITVIQSSFALGNWEIWASMIIASVKATLVMAFFMHMAFEKPFNAIMFLSSFLFVTLFVGFLLMDANAYNDKIIIKPIAEEVR